LGITQSDVSAARTALGPRVHSLTALRANGIIQKVFVSDCQAAAAKVGSSAAAPAAPEPPARPVAATSRLMRRPRKSKPARRNGEQSDVAAEVQHRERPLPWRPPRGPDLDKRRHARSRCTEIAGSLGGEFHARRATTTDQPRLWLMIHVRIIGVHECPARNREYRTPRVG
jgi:hypothetical protein